MSIKISCANSSNTLAGFWKRCFSCSGGIFFDRRGLQLSQSIASVIVGFVLGGLSYTLANYILNKKSLGSTKHRKKSHGENAGGGKGESGLALLVGSVMDNIPENMALGISLVTGGAVNIVLIAAIFLSNFPEGYPLRKV
jgi:zinc transporter ZupT